jgi:hypothetical protein
MPLRMSRVGRLRPLTVGRLRAPVVRSPLKRIRLHHSTEPWAVPHANRLAWAQHTEPLSVASPAHAEPATSWGLVPERRRVPARDRALHPSRVTGRGHEPAVAAAQLVPRPQEINVRSTGRQRPDLRGTGSFVEVALRLPLTARPNSSTSCHGRRAAKTQRALLERWAARRLAPSAGFLRSSEHRRPSVVA